MRPAGAPCPPDKATACPRRASAVARSVLFRFPHLSPSPVCPPGCVWNGRRARRGVGKRAKPGGRCTMHTTDVRLTFRARLREAGNVGGVPRAEGGLRGRPLRSVVIRPISGVGVRIHARSTHICHSAVSAQQALYSIFDIRSSCAPGRSGNQRSADARIAAEKLIASRASWRAFERIPPGKSVHTRCILTVLLTSHMGASLRGGEVTPDDRIPTFCRLLTFQA